MKKFDLGIKAVWEVTGSKRGWVYIFDRYLNLFR